MDNKFSKEGSRNNGPRKNTSGGDWQKRSEGTRSGNYNRVDRGEDRGERRPFNRNSEGGERRSFNRSSEGGERRSFNRSSEGGERRSFNRNSEGGERRSFNRNSEGGERRSFNRNSEGGERRSFNRNSEGGERRSFNRNSEGGERRSFNRNSEGGERRSFNRNSEGGERRSFNRNSEGGERRSFNRNSEGGERRSFNRNSEGGERRSFNRNSEGGERRSFNRNSEGGERRSFNRNSEGGERRSFNRNSEGGERRSFNRNDRNGARRSFNRNEERSFNPDVNADLLDEDALNSMRERHYSKKKILEHKIKSVATSEDAELRLNRFISISGICSRRDADELISSGRVSVNGVVVDKVGTKVSKKDTVLVDGEAIIPEKKVYLVLNKPKDYVTTMDDPLERKTVMNLISSACKERVYPIGRLDRQTTGVLLFTNDGDLAKKLTHPSFEHKKIYHVFLDKVITPEQLIQIGTGIQLEDGLVKADDISYASDNGKEVGIEIHSGKNRIVRRIFESLGFKIDKLDRVYFAGITKKNLPRGKWRMLTPDEVEILKYY